MLRDGARSRGGVRGPRILLVEDDVRNIFALTSVLEPQGREARRSPATAARRSTLLRRPRRHRPRADGHHDAGDGRPRGDARRSANGAASRSCRSSRSPPRRCPTTATSCLAAGANDYIAKPLDVDKLLSLCRVWMPQVIDDAARRPTTSSSSCCSTRSTRATTTTSALRRASLRRRMRHALAALRLRQPRRAAATACCTSPSVFAQLLQYLTVQVSDMFRDPPYFRALREQRRARPAHLSVVQDLGRRLQHRRGGVLARDPAARGRTCSIAR